MSAKSAVAIATGPLLVATLAFIAGMGFGSRWSSARQLPQAHAMSSLAYQSFAVCTTPVDANTEGLFILDFETGDLTGGVLSPNGKFASTYRHNVLEDLGIEIGTVKNPRFMIVPGMAKVGAGSARMAQSVLYVTDSATGVTVAYGIPTGGKPAAALVPLDMAKPRGGGLIP